MLVATSMPLPESPTTVELVGGLRVLASWPLAASRPALSVIDELARLQLVARRCGCRIRIRAPSARLAQLLEIMGLDLVVATIDEPGVEARGGAEDGWAGGGGGDKSGASALPQEPPDPPSAP